MVIQLLLILWTLSTLNYAVHNMDHFAQDSADEAFTYSYVNQDLRNAALLQKMDIEGLSAQHMVIVDYKGQRVMAQSVIPGILNQEQQDQTQYGSLDNGTSVKSDPEFHELFRKVAKGFCLEEEVEFEDEGKQVHKINGGLDVKGILGSDKRKYILDSMRLSPRDMNYEGEENNCCVIRFELIENYYLHKCIEKANLSYQAFKDQEAKEKEEAKKKEETQENGKENGKEINQNKENDKNNQKDNQEDQKSQPQIQKSEEELMKELEEKRKEAILKEQKEYEKLMEQRKKDYTKFQEILAKIQTEDQEAYKFNSNLFTGCKLKEEKPEQVENLKSLAKYLKDTAIANLLKEMYEDLTQGRLADSKALSSLLHAHGVNNRYLGAIYSQVDQSLYPHIGFLIEKAIFARCLKHLLREKMREAPKGLLPHQIAHVFNCLFSGQKAQESLNQGKLKMELEVSQNNKKKGKKGKQPKSQQFSDTPSTLFNRLTLLAQKRYQHSLTWSLTSLSSDNKWSVLRDVCISTGIVLLQKNYSFEDSEVKSYKDLPFSAEHIQDLKPVTKSIKINHIDVKQHMDVGLRFFQEERYAEAGDMFKVAVQILANLHGPLHQEIAECYQKLAQVYFKLDKKEQAVVFQKLAVGTLKRLYTVFHPQTAHAYFFLGQYYSSMAMYSQAERTFLKSLYYKKMIGGDRLPDLQTVLMNLSMVYQQNKQHPAAIDCLLSANQLIKKVFGPNSLRSASLFQALAMVHFELQDFKKAVDYQKQACEVYQQMKVQDQRALYAQVYLKNLTFQMEEALKAQNPTEEQRSGRKFGSNKTKKVVKADPQVQEGPNEQEQQILQEKLRLAKLHFRQQRNQKNFKVFN